MPVVGWAVKVILLGKNLVGPTVTGPVQEPPAITRLENPLCIPILDVLYSDRNCSLGNFATS